MKNILAGALVLTPLLATWLVVEFLFNTLSRLGQPGTSAFFTAIYRFSPELAEWLSTPWVEYIIAVVLTLVVLYFLGWATTHVLGRHMLAWFEALLDRVPPAPNPTSGYIEIVPVAEVISTDWTLDEAMQFVITAGTTAPNTITFLKECQRPRQTCTSTGIATRAGLSTHRHTKP